MYTRLCYVLFIIILFMYTRLCYVRFIIILFMYTRLCYVLFIIILFMYTRLCYVLLIIILFMYTRLCYVRFISRISSLRNINSQGKNKFIIFWSFAQCFFFLIFFIVHGENFVTNVKRRNFVVIFYLINDNIW